MWPWSLGEDITTHNTRYRLNFLPDFAAHFYPLPNIRSSQIILSKNCSRQTWHMTQFREMTGNGASRFSTVFGCTQTLYLVVNTIMAEPLGKQPSPAPFLAENKRGDWNRSKMSKHWYCFPLLETAISKKRNEVWCWVHGVPSRLLNKQLLILTLEQ